MRLTISTKSQSGIQQKTNYLQSLLKGLQETQNINHLLPFNHDQRGGAGAVRGLNAGLGEDSHDDAPCGLVHHTP